jgi:hypothetical protein
VQLRRTLLTVGLTLAGTLLLLVGLRIAGAGPHNYADEEAVRMAVAKELLQERNSESGVFYLGFYDDRDPLSEELIQLAPIAPHLQLHPFSERDAANDQCDEPQLVTAWCTKDDFLQISFRTMILWRTAEIAWWTSACHGTFIAIKGFKRWLIISEQLSVWCT